jgi:hypothetical protein
MSVCLLHQGTGPSILVCLVQGHFYKWPLTRSVLRAVLVMTGRVRQPLPLLQFSVSEVHMLQFGVLQLIFGFMHCI